MFQTYLDSFATVFTDDMLVYSNIEQDNNFIVKDFTPEIEERETLSQVPKV